MTLQKPYVANAAFVLEFAQPVAKIRFEQGRAEEAFSALVGASSQQTNVPDSMDPNLPRIIFTGSNKVVSISQARLQMDFSFSTGGINEQLAIIKKNSLAFHSAATNKFALESFSLTAVIVNIQMSSSGETLELYQLIRDKFFGDPKVDLEFASAQVALGYKVGDYFINLGADVFEQRQFSTEGFVPGKMIFVKSTEGELVDKGLVFKVDVNNRPKLAKGGVIGESADEYFDVLDKFLRESFPKISEMELL